MNGPWQVLTAGPGTTDIGVAPADSLVFTAQQTVEFVSTIPQTLVNQTSGPTPTHEWGTWTSATANTMTGFTHSGNRPFLIEYDPNKNQLTCTLDPARPVQFSAIALGAIAGTLVGTVVGLIAGSPALGAMTGLVAGSTGSAVTAARINLDKAQTGPVVTWVANDGGAGRGQKPGPQILKSASA